MLEIAGLNVRYGAVEALRDVSIKVGPGSLVAILGANGAGNGDEAARLDLDRNISQRFDRAIAHIEMIDLEHQASSPR